MNLAGVERVFELEDKLDRMQRKVDELETRADALQEEIERLEEMRRVGQGRDRALRGAGHGAHPDPARAARALTGWAGSARRIPR